MDGGIKYRKSLINSTKNISLGKRLNNVTQKQIDDEIRKIRLGNGRPGYSVSEDGKLMVDGREVIALEGRDKAMIDMSNRHGQPGIDRLHSLLERKYANISKRKVGMFVKNSETHQMHTSAPSKKFINRPAWSSNALKIAQIDLADYRSMPSRGKQWHFTFIDLYSKFLVAGNSRSLMV